MGLIYKWESQLNSAKIWFEASLLEAVSEQDSIRAVSELILLPLLDKDYDKVINKTFQDAVYLSRLGCTM